MIKATVYVKDNKICEIEVAGHAEFSEAGKDIVCAAVSTLMFNTINAIEAFTEIPFGCDVEEKNGGYLKLAIPKEGMEDHDTQLLLKTMELGLTAIETEYDRYLTLIHKEV